MMKLVTADGLEITSDMVHGAETSTPDQDARRTAGLAFLKEAGLTLDDRLLSDDVQSIIDGLLFSQTEDLVA